MPSNLKKYKTKSKKMRPQSMSAAIRRGARIVATPNIPQIRADIQAGRRAAEPFLLFEGNLNGGGLANYAEARKVAQKLMNLCDKTEQLCNDSDRKARESHGL